MLKTTFLAISFTLYSYIMTYTLNSEACTNQFGQQSPIDVDSYHSAYYEEKYFRLLTNNYENVPVNTTWTSFPNERAVGIQGSPNFGSIILVKDWALHNFFLQKVLFKVGSEHTVDNVKYDVEMQLIHTYDDNYYNPGRRVDPGVNYMVISYFFKRTSDDNPAASRLFEFMDLQGYQNKTTNGQMKKPIKFHYMVQHQPAYMYQGTLTYPDCQQALWVVNSQYHLIRESDFNLLKEVSADLIDPVLNTNVRSQSTRTVTVYRNFQDLTKLVPRATMMSYDSAQGLKMNIVMMLIIIIAIFI
jgi:carbonic anhydrase